MSKGTIVQINNGKRTKYKEQNKKEKIPILNQEVMQQPERRRREGRCSARFAFARRSSLFCVPVLFLYLCLLWVYVFYGFYVGSAKLQCGATPPSVMVLLKDETNKKGAGCQHYSGSCGRYQHLTPGCCCNYPPISAANLKEF